MNGRVQYVLATAGVLAICAGNLPAAAAAATEPALSAGVEASVALAAPACQLKIFLPTNYIAGQKWPALFFYNGKGMDPDPTLLRRFTDERDYIVVAMPYIAYDDRPRTPQELADCLQCERACFHAALAWLSANAGVDETRVFLAGVSKGGWTAGFIGEMEMPRLGGIIILLAGRLPGQAAAMPTLQNKPVYIGAGESDPNWFSARSAREFYRRNGANVCFEEFSGVGHEVPLNARRIRAWLQTQGRYRQNPDTNAVQQEATAELQAGFNAALAEANALAQYKQLLALADDPRLKFCDANLRQQMKTKLAAAVQASPGKEEWSAESAFNELLYREAAIRRLADMKAVLDGFQNLVQTHPQTRFGQVAAQYYPRLADTYQKSVQATLAANSNQPPASTNRTVLTPTFPVITRDPPRPIKHGDKIIIK
jgi:predicted esterase